VRPLLVRALEWLRPASVAEVGFGYGLNLLLLSMQFPAIRFAGVELTQAGLDKARSLSADPLTPGQLESFAVGALRDVTAPGRLDLRQGSADALPLEDKSVDVAVTVLALEQMEQIRDQAIAELSRVARQHVVMIEPFADWNMDGHRREYIRRHDYFAARVADLPRYGLVPLVATADMPNKLSFRAGLVVAAVEGRG
jgi:ubiquinone/menaquinone biosynthesis C-methylase UbiE